MVKRMTPLSEIEKWLPDRLPGGPGPAIPRMGHEREVPAGIEPPALPAPGDPLHYAGTYTAPAADVAVPHDDGRVWLLQQPKGVFARYGEPRGPEEFVRLRGDTFVRVTARQGVHGTVVFLGNDGQGHPHYLHGGRVSRRVAR
jgi:hypothetical protein